MTVAKVTYPERIEDVEPLYPSIPRSNEPHAIHQRIAEIVGALDEFRTFVNITRLKFGESKSTLDRLDAAMKRLDDAENCIYNARLCIEKRRR